MKVKMKKLLSLVLTLVMVLSAFPAVSAANAAPEVKDIRDGFTRPEDGSQACDPEAWVTVIVELEGDTTLDVEDFVTEFRSASQQYAQNTTVAAYRENMVSVQEDLQNQILAINSDILFRYHYTNLLNGFAAKVQYQDIAAIKALDGVLNVYQTQTYSYVDTVEDEETLEYISLDELDGEELTEGYYTDGSVFDDALGSSQQLNLKPVWANGYTGKGKVVGVFDSSLRYTHEMFAYMDPEITAAKPGNYKTKQGLLNTINSNAGTLNLFDEGWGSWYHGLEHTGFDAETQAAIRNGDFWYNEKVPFAVDYMDGDLEVWDGDTGSHGTHVSGIAAGNAGPGKLNGVKGGAYDAQIMFFKVFSEHDPVGQESDEAVFAALDDAVTLGVNAFNLSLGLCHGFSTMNTYAQAGYQKAYNRAAAAGINIAVSSGNDARDTHSGSLIGSTPIILPNNSMSGFSGSFLAPFTVASAQGTGYSYKTNKTTASFTDGEGTAIEALADIALSDNNDGTTVGEALTESYEIVDCDTGSEEAILTATGATELAGALTDKIALMKYVRNSPLDYLGLGINAKAAGAAGLIVVNRSNSTSALAVAQIAEGIPTFGMISTSTYSALQTALESGTVKVSFTSETWGTENNRTYADNGPSGFTSWGVTGSLKMKPDIMTPGGAILSTGAGSDWELSIKSGTSMASPNMEGCFILVQQYVDENLDLFGVEQGTQAYTDLVNQLVASTATPYQPMVSSSDPTRQNLYFSPRRQGAGMANIEAATTTQVVLHNGKAVDPMTGEAPRTKVELGDKLGTEFDVTFYVHNYSSRPKTFDVLACLQTDATTSSTRYGTQIASVASYGSDIDPIEDAVLTVTAVSGAGSVDAESANINRYAEDAAPATITVPGKGEVTVTVHVALNATTMATYDETFINGMFLEGFVFLEGKSLGQVNLNVPFLGFRGDWSDAPIFDLATAYEDVSEKETSDPTYPMYYVTTLSSRVGEGEDEAEVVLGANQYTGAAWPGYSPGDKMNAVRNYLNTQRTAGDFSGALSAISPNGDGYSDFVYANLALLQNAKALLVVITDKDGNTVKTIGPEFEYFETNLGNSMTGLGDIAQIAATYGQTFGRNMAWDGTDAEGNVVADGQYNYKVIAIKEYEFLNEGLTPTTSWDKKNHVMTGMDDAYMKKVADVLLASKTADSVTMPVKVDTAAPEIVISDTYEVTVTDDNAVQAVVVYYNGEQVGTVTKCNTASATVQVPAEVTGAEGFDANKLEVQAVDYAFNRATSKEEPPVLTLAADKTSAYVDDAVTLTVTAEPALAEGTVYQWFKSDKADGSDAQQIEDATEATYTPSTSETGTTYYFCSVDAGMFPVRSNVVGLTVSTKPSSGGGGGSKPVQKPDDEQKPADEQKPDDTTPTVTDFADVSGHWAADSIKTVVEAGLFKGTTDNTFSPDTSVDRAMFTTILYRLNGETGATGTSQFPDAVQGSWYYDAVLWATEHSVVLGLGDGTFAPSLVITREQMAAMLYRYAVFAGHADDTIQPLVGYTDADAISSWAADAMAWAVDNGYITGKTNNRLDPQGLATRAEAATILARYLEANKTQP